MIGSIFGVLCIISLAISAITGNTQALGNAVLDSASGAVELTLSLCGIMCLWGGVMQVLTDAGAVRRLARLMSPFLRVFFPTAWQTGIGADDIAANISANLLGVGNAATPLALRAMSAMQSVNPEPGTASADMITLAVLNTASVSLVPSTVVALRRAAGAAEPYAVVVPVWICSLAGATLALVCCRLAAGCAKCAGRRAARSGQTVHAEPTPASGRAAPTKCAASTERRAAHSGQPGSQNRAAHSDRTPRARRPEKS